MEAALDSVQRFVKGTVTKITELCQLWQHASCASAPQARRLSEQCDSIVGAREKAIIDVVLAMQIQAREQLSVVLKTLEEAAGKHGADNEFAGIHLEEYLDNLDQSGSELSWDRKADIIVVIKSDAARALYNDFRFFNEKLYAIADQVSNALNSGKEIFAWSDDVVVRRAGKLAASMTVMTALFSDQDLAARQTKLRSVTAAVRNLGHGLMEPHACVQASVAAVLKKVPQAEAKPPPAKKPKQ